MFIGALSSINSFLFIMYALYQNNTGLKFITTFLVIVLFIVTVGTIYILAVKFLKYINKFSFVLLTLSIILFILCLLFLFPIITGIGYLNPRQFFFDFDGILTNLAIVYTSLVCSYGIWVSEKQRSKIPFYIIALCTIITSVIIF